MTWEKVTYNGNDIWNKCYQYGVKPDAYTQLNAECINSSTPGLSHITLRDSADPAAETARTLVLISPELSNKIITGLISTLKRKLTSCGFNVNEAYFYERVIVVDPDQDFADADLIQLQNTGIEVERLPGLANEMGQKLEDALS